VAPFENRGSCQAIQQGGVAAVHESDYGRYCCKSRFALGVGNSAGYRCDFRVKMRGASSPHVKPTKDFANTSEAIRIGDCFLFDSFAKNSSPCNFRLLQQYRHVCDVKRRPTYVRVWCNCGYATPDVSLLKGRRLEIFALEEIHWTASAD
jgi:hypothetical protein